MTRLIKKYKNRRLYDTELSQYITVEDLQRYVIDGMAFHVQDSTTDKDITNATLLQILVDMEAGPTQFLSSDLLRQLITLAQHPMHQSSKAMLEQVVTLIQKQIQANPYINDYQKATDAWNKQMEQFLTQWQNLYRK